MTAKHRLVLALLIGVFTASALGRVDLGADTEPSVLNSALFRLGLIPAILAGWVAAPQLGQGWVRAVLTCLAVVLVVAVPLGLYAGRGALGLVLALPQHNLALASLALALVAPQILALRQSRK
ncbi:hypothetical protein [Paragemmobacter straminiformis]|uniref:Uncharacterized protein n=1 Tax=Paragemmobacter straminiformis TaxID=2045119 RepID=A0A842I7Z5_9RHOB|nr:hypothetical protein [Gemmobacter straminiformis]MBC2835759.1 hypothetical protein [Gemmobacter straminiformis]